MTMEGINMKDDGSLNYWKGIITLVKLALIIAIMVYAILYAIINTPTLSDEPTMEEIKSNSLMELRLAQGDLAIAQHQAEKEREEK